MIKFINNNESPPYIEFRKRYEQAINRNQPFIEAISISSFCKKNNQVDSRFVNLKYIDNKKFIFFTNYNSPKSMQFEGNNKVAVNTYWHAINTQIRIKALIKKTDRDFNPEYFQSRTKEKNALAISSNQSGEIDSFESIKQKYQSTLNNKDLGLCPDYWGGFSFTPFQFEFWKGNSFRLNKRDLYKQSSDEWEHVIIEP